MPVSSSMEAAERPCLARDVWASKLLNGRKKTYSNRLILIVLEIIALLCFVAEIKHAGHFSALVVGSSQ